MNEYSILYDKHIAPLEKLEAGARITVNGVECIKIHQPNMADSNYDVSGSFVQLTDGTMLKHVSHWAIKSDVQIIKR